MLRERGVRAACPVCGFSAEPWVRYRKALMWIALLDLPPRKARIELSCIQCDAPFGSAEVDDSLQITKVLS